MNDVSMDDAAVNDAGESGTVENDAGENNAGENDAGENDAGENDAGENGTGMNETLVNEPANDVAVQPLSALTTLRVGGAPRRMIAPGSETELVDAVREILEAGEDYLLLGGGSNTVASDDGFDGTLIRLATRGIERVPAEADSDPQVVRLRVQAGEPWDDLVAHTVANGWAGIEALSGIPGCCGAAPVQNIGAYGQELSSSLVAVTLLDFDTHEVVRLPAAELELGYRTSSLKTGKRTGVVLAIELDLIASASAVDASIDGASIDGALGDGAPGDAMRARSAPVAYAQLAGALGVQLGDRVPLAQVREAVLRLRASKGMVLDASDPDTFSAGSFFTNPIVRERFARALPEDAPRWPVAVSAAGSGAAASSESAVGAGRVPVTGQADTAHADTALPGTAQAATAHADTAMADTAMTGTTLPDGARVTPLDAVAQGEPIDLPPPRSASPEPVHLVKLSAAWLIEHSGIVRGFSLPGSRAAISSKHTLAITNRGGATAAEIVQLARFVQGRVQAEFGVILQPEPVLVGLSL